MTKTKEIFYNLAPMEDAHLFESKLTILQEISSAIAASDNINTVTNLMLELAINYTLAEKGSLMLLNDEEELTIFAARGIEDKFIRTYKAKIGEGVAGIVAKGRFAVLVTDIKNDKRFKEKTRDRYKTRSFICCPIVSRKKLLGVLNINDKKDESTFTDDEFTLIKIIADQAAVALENAILMNQLRTKAIELEETNRKLIETDIVKTEFLTRMSHELRTPLNSIKGSVYYLKDSPDIPKNEKAEFYGIISKETDQLIHIVENLLDFLRLEDETRITKISIVNLTEILAEVAESRALKLFLEKEKIHLSFHINEKISDIIADKTKVIQLLINMIEGLACHLQKGNSMDISVHQGDFVTVTLLCSGQIPDSALAYLFHPKIIFKAEDPDNVLKLYLANQVIKYHNWNLHTENTEKGLSLRITIPKSSRQKLDAVVDSTLDMFIDFISEMLDVNLCSIMLGDELTGDLTIKSSRGLNADIINKTRIKIGDSIAGWVALEGKPLFIADIEHDQRFRRTSINQYDTKSLISVPIKLHDRVAGVINLNNKKTKLPFTVMDFFVANTISDRISNFFSKLYAGEFNEKSLKQFMGSFKNLVSIGRKYHKKGNPSAEMIFKIMEHLQRTEEEKKIAVYVSMVYDLGMVPLDEGIKQKKTLTASELLAVRGHPHTTVNLLEGFEFSDEVKRAIEHHHERFDGTGYPDGLKAEEIPFISRVLHAVDTFYAMTGERQYRKTLTEQEALKEIKKASGTIYDPTIVEALEKILQ